MPNGWIIAGIVWFLVAILAVYLYKKFLFRNGAKMDVQREEARLKPIILSRLGKSYDE